MLEWQKLHKDVKLPASYKLFIFPICCAVHGSSAHSLSPHCNLSNQPTASPAVPVPTSSSSFKHSFMIKVQLFAIYHCQVCAAALLSCVTAMEIKDHIQSFLLSPSGWAEYPSDSKQQNAKYKSSH